MGREPILQKVWIIKSSFPNFNFKIFKDPNSLSYIRFQCILHDSGVRFSVSLNFYILKMGELISWGTNSAQSLNYFVPSSVFQF